MFNLLPDSLKGEIIKEYRLRLIVVILVFIMFIILSFIIFMSPSLVVSYFRENELKQRVEVLDKTAGASNINSIKPVIKSLNSDLSSIDKTLKYSEVVPLINSVLSEKTSSIYITDISYTSISSSTASVVVQGVSTTRDALVSFKKSLEDTKIFKSIDLPISNLAKDKDIKFSMTMVSNVKI